MLKILVTVDEYQCFKSLTVKTTSMRLGHSSIDAEVPLLII